MKKSVFILACLLAPVLSISSVVSGYVPPTSYTWGAGTPNYNATATVHTGTINTSGLAIGDFLGMSSSQLVSPWYGDSGVSVGWDDTYTMPVGNGNTNGDALDGLWIQTFSNPAWFDLGASYSTVAVFTAQDHGPYVGEGTEYRVYGATTLWDMSSLGTQANMTDLYLDGWRAHNASEDNNGNGWLSDDISGVLDLGGSYRYIVLMAWGGGSYYEPEIDAVAGVGPVIPAPGAIVLGSIGVSLVGWLRRRRAL